MAAMNKYAQNTWLQLPCFCTIFLLILVGQADALPSDHAIKIIRKINAEGKLLGIVVPNAFELSPLLNSSAFVPNARFPVLDVSGRRFRFGTIHGRKVAIIMSGLGMLNSGLSTQLLLSLFSVRGILHYGIAGNADPDLHVGDVTIPRSWAHTGLWNWQRYGEGPRNELAFESNGDYTRKIGNLRFADSNVNSSLNNYLNRVWYQPEEVFAVGSTPEVRQHYFWVDVNKHYFRKAKALERLKPERCLNSTTCLSHEPKVVRVERGSSANVFVDNAAYRNFLFNKFKVTAIDMESAAVGLVCLAEKMPFLVIRALSDLAGGSSESNEAAVFGGLSSLNAANAVVGFIKLL